MCALFLPVSIHPFFMSHTSGYLFTGRTGTNTQAINQSPSSIKHNTLDVDGAVGKGDAGFLTQYQSAVTIYPASRTC